MSRRTSCLVLGIALSLVPGCWHPRCGEGTGVCTANGSGTIANQPCRLVGNSKMIAEGCYDAVTGQPVPCPPPGSGMVLPGNGLPTSPYPQPMQTPDVLPFPGETIPPSSIPNAQPTPAPGLSANPNVMNGQPVRISPTK